MFPSGWRPDLVIFDCDGVLIDSEIISANTLLGLLEARGLDIGIDHVKTHFLGRSFPTVAATIRSQFDHSLPADFESQYRRLLLSEFETSLRATPGVTDILERLAIRCCVATSSSPERVGRSLQIVGLDRFFGAHVYTASEVERGKPAPDIFLHVAAREGVEPASCLVVEDSMPGVQAALNAGMPVVRYVGGSHFGPGRPAAADNCPAFDKWPDFFDMIPSLEKETTGSARHGEQG
ncbi:MAG: HAD family hydrolase [Rhizobiaceae bacterium]